MQKPVRHAEPVLNQRLNGRYAHIRIEAAVGFTAADAGGSGNIIKGDAFRVMLMDIFLHLLNADLGGKLHPGDFMPWNMVKVSVHQFKYTAQMALDRHFVAVLPIFQAAVDFLKQPVCFRLPSVFLPENNIRKAFAAQYGQDVLLINAAAFRSNQLAIKHYIGHGLPFAV